MSKAEQTIKNSTRNWSNALCSVEDRNGKKVFSYYQWLTPDAALEAVRIAREEVIEEAVKWLNNNTSPYFTVIRDPSTLTTVVDFLNEKFLMDFKKAMKGE